MNSEKHELLVKQLSLRKSEIVRYRDKENVYNPEYDVFQENYIIDRAVKKDIWHLMYVTNKMTDSEVYEQWSRKLQWKSFLNATFIV